MTQKEKKVLQENLEQFRNETIEMISKWMPHAVGSVSQTLNEKFDAFEDKLNSELNIK